MCFKVLLILFINLLSSVNNEDNGTILNSAKVDKTTNPNILQNKTALMFKNTVNTDDFRDIKMDTTPKPHFPNNGSAPISATKVKCIDDFKEIKGNISINVTEYCKEKVCVSKCCSGRNRILYLKGNKPECKEVSEIQSITRKHLDIDYSAISIFKSDVEKTFEKSKTSLNDVIFIRNKKLSRGVCTSGFATEPMLNYHILEDGTFGILVEDRPNFYNRFINSWKMKDFCFEHLVKHEKDKIHEPILIYRVYMPHDITESDTKIHENSDDIYKSVAMLISCFFLILVIFVYAVIPELRNLNGMILMAYVSTLAVTFFFKAVEVFTVYHKVDMKDVCRPLTAMLYFTILSSFFWMNMMSLDIWWTFRGNYKSRAIHRKGESSKFWRYALYSWGIPLLVTIAVTVIDYSDLSHLPNVYKPHFELCFYMKGTEGIEMRHYLYYPILSLLIVDCIFFLMTAFNIWRIRKDIEKFNSESNKYKNNKNRFGLYLKLSIVMGISWVLEVVYNLPWWLEKIATAYNSLIGVAIFIIFVFKRKIMFRLCKRFSIKSKFVENLEKTLSKYSTTASQHSRKRCSLELSTTIA